MRACMTPISSGVVTEPYGPILRPNRIPPDGMTPPLTVDGDVLLPSAALLAFGFLLFRVPLPMVAAAAAGCSSAALASMTLVHSA